MLESMYCFSSLDNDALLYVGLSHEIQDYKSLTTVYIGIW